MKKFFFILLFWSGMLPVMAQYNYLTVSGTVTDIPNGAPIANHPVTIQIDSISQGFSYYSVVYTYSNGFYVDTIFFNMGYVPTGWVFVSTLDCQQQMHFGTFPFGPGNQAVVKDFQICNTPSTCNADFYAVPDSSNPMNVYFIDQSTGSPIDSWFWDFGDGQTAHITFPASPNVTHLYAQPGTYTVCLTIQSNDSTCFDSYCAEVVVGNNTGCQAQFTWYPDSINGGTQTIHFIDLSVGGGSSWYWYFGDSTYSTEQNPVHTFPQPGIYYVCLTITGQNPACQSTWCTNVTVGNNSGCVSYFTFSQNNLNVAFEGHMVNGQQATYSWSFGDGTGGSGQNVTHAYASQGMYYVSLTTTTGLPNGTCTYTSGQTIQVGDSTQFNQVYGQVFEGNFPLTSGIVMIFSTDTLNANAYWDLAIVDSMGIYSFSYVPSGNFIVWAIPTDNSNYLPTYYGDVLFWQDATVITLGQPANPYHIHLIETTNASAGPGGINGHINAGNLKNGLDDKVRMILMNEQGNAIGFEHVSSTGDFAFSTLGYGVYFLLGELPGVSSDLIRVEITQEKPVVNVIMTYSGSHLLGVNDPVSPVESFNAFPNPFNDLLNINVNAREATDISITVTDMAGRTVVNYSAWLNAGINSQKINTSSLQPGIYLLKITGQDRTSLTRKIVKTK